MKKIIVKVVDAASTTPPVSKSLRMARFVGIVFLLLAFMGNILSCDKGLLEASDTGELHSKLSDYSIFSGEQSNLFPSSEYRLYELSSQLFTDYAEKQRLIKIPSGTSMRVTGNGLLGFPAGTILVKTFFYYHDRRDTSKGKNIVETRLLVKSENEWTFGTYLWNKDQTDATLITTGLNKTVNWIDEAGEGNVISYHIPANNECVTCHNSNNTATPIGLKVRNLNRDVVRNATNQNQLSYLHHEGVLNSVDPSLFLVLPDYKNAALSLLSRSRAYLDVNCAHCHNDSGFASNKRLRMDYETSLEESKITHSKGNILYQMQNGKMSKIGITVVDREGLALIRSFMDSLRSN